MPPISLQTNNKTRGLTLIEILFAVIIFAGSLMFISSNIYRTENTVKKTIRDLKSLNRTLYSVSRLKNKNYRLSLETGENASYWVEKKQNQREAFLNQQSRGLMISEEEEEPSLLNIVSSYEEDPDFEKKLLPEGLSFEPFEDSAQNNIINIIYDPMFFSPPTKVFLQLDSKARFTLFFDPLKGELEVTEDKNDSR